MRLIRALTFAFLIVLVGTPATHAASPPLSPSEPHGYHMTCDLNGRIFGVNEPSECRGGYVRIFSTYDNSLVGHIDMYALELGLQKGDFRASYHECLNNVVCRIGVTAAEVYVGGKVKGAWSFLKGVLRL